MSKPTITIEQYNSLMQLYKDSQSQIAEMKTDYEEKLTKNNEIVADIKKQFSGKLVYNHKELSRWVGSRLLKEWSHINKDGLQEIPEIIKKHEYCYGEQYTWYEITDFNEELIVKLEKLAKGIPNKQLRNKVDKLEGSVKYWKELAEHKEKSRDYYRKEMEKEKRYKNTYEAIVWLGLFLLLFAALFTITIFILAILA